MTQLTQAVVTGASGFLGRLVAGRLAAAGVRVLGIDLAPAPPLPQNAAPWEHLALPLEQAAEACREFLSAPGGSALLHLAGLADAEACRANPEKAFALNVGLVSQALEICRKAGTEQGACLVLPSTGLVYGPGVSASGPLTESAPTHPWGVYAAAKIAAEALVLGYGAEQRLPVAVARLSNVYGAGGGENTVVGRILAQALAGGPVTVRDERPMRDFLHAHDAAEGLIQLARAALKRGHGFPLLANLSTGQGATVGGVVDMACELFQVSRGISGLGSGPEREQDKGPAPLPLVLDNSRLLQYTGWKPTIGLAEGLRLCATTTANA